MLYNVRAKPKPRELARFWTLLNNGTISDQEPDGREIIASMKRAIIDDGTVKWSETCYCSPPLKHERATIYDQFFTEIETEPRTGSTSMSGPHFWQYLRENFGEPSETGRGGMLSAGLRFIPLRIL